MIKGQNRSAVETTCQNIEQIGACLSGPIASAVSGIHFVRRAHSQRRIAQNIQHPPAENRVDSILAADSEAGRGDFGQAAVPGREFGFGNGRRVKRGARGFLDLSAAWVALLRESRDCVEEYPKAESAPAGGRSPAQRLRRLSGGKYIRLRPVPSRGIFGETDIKNPDIETIGCQ